MVLLLLVLSICIDFTGEQHDSVDVRWFDGRLSAGGDGWFHPNRFLSVGVSVWCAECHVFWRYLCPLYVLVCRGFSHKYHLHALFYTPRVGSGYFCCCRIFCWTLLIVGDCLYGI
jgi:hypothetical protein